MASREEKRLPWFRHPTGRWSRFKYIDSDMANTIGVFVIWQSGYASTVYVGHGNVRDEIVRLRRHEPVSRYGESLLIAWATIQSEDIRVRAHRHLYEVLKPTVRTDVTTRPPLRVNTPNN